MDDLIRRQAAIDALGERPMVWTSDDDYALGEQNQYDADRLAIETVPSAERYARWEYTDYGGIGNWHCSACHGICMLKFKRCPYCGAKMDLR